MKGYTYNYEPPSRTEPAINIKDLDKNSVDEMLAQIKDQVIPGIKEQLSQVSFYFPILIFPV